MVTKLRTSPSPLPADAAQRRSPVQSAAVQTAAAGAGRTMVPEFRLLGLQPREARVEIIRQALQSTAAQVQLADVEQPANAEQPDDVDEQLVRIAIAGYHLLDPRRRRSLYERVQLLLWTEEERDALAMASSSSVWSMPPRIVATPIRPPEPPAESPLAGDQRRAPGKSVSDERSPAVAASASSQFANDLTDGAALASSAEEERQVALELFRSLRTRQRQATVLWIGVMAIMLSLLTALGLFALIAPQL